MRERFNTDLGANLERQLRNLKAGYVLLFVFLAAGVLLALSFLVLPPGVNIICGAIGSSLLGVAIVGFAYEWLTKRNTERLFSTLLREALEEQDTRIVSKIVSVLLGSKEQLKETVLADYYNHLLKEIIKVKTRDEVIANELVDGFLEKIFSYKQRWHNRQHRIILRLLSGDEFTEDVRNRYYGISIEMSYNTVLDKESFKFICVSDKESFDKAVSNGEYEYTYLLYPTEFTCPFSPEVFSVHHVRIGDINLTETSCESRQSYYSITYSAPNLNALIGKDISVSYVIETLVLKRNHKFFSKILFPTKRTSTIFDYSGTDIASVSVREFYVSARPPVIQYLPSNHPRSVTITVQDWVFPESGEIFVWNYPKELYENI